MELEGLIDVHILESQPRKKCSVDPSHMPGAERLALFEGTSKNNVFSRDIFELTDK